MDPQIEKTLESLESSKKLTAKGGEYWMGRDLQVILGYAKWDNFEGVIQKAIVACVASGVDADDHFLDTRKVITAGKGAKIERGDYYLDRYASYLVAMNGESNKVEIAAAQTYFAIQTRRQEIQDANLLLENRMVLRERVTAAFKALNSTAKDAGLQNYPLFHDAGYRGLYEMGISGLKKHKGLGDKDDLYDRVGRTELAANEFRLTQAQEKIKRENIQGQQALMNTHKSVGAEVRNTIRKLGGTMPENLPIEPSLKKLAKDKKNALPKAKRLASPGSPTE